LKVLVIGGTKFLGYHLVQRLIAMEIDVTVFNRGITPDDFGDKIQRVLGDRKDYKNFFEIFRKQPFDVVVDLIGYEADDIEVAIKTFKDHVGQYIFISTGQVYLVTKNLHQPATEEDYNQDIIECPPGEEPAYLYGINKRKCEDLLVSAFNFQHFPSVRFRCPIIHGARDYTLRLYSYLIRLLDDNPIIIPHGGDSVIRHVYVEDVVNSII
jgi:nucleoside-diphosphate-sugar epimerase